MKVNYQKELDKFLSELEGDRGLPSLLIHSCCAPCSSYVLEYLMKYFRITIYYYNPNIYPQSEFLKRLDEQVRLVDEFSGLPKSELKLLQGDYEPEEFLSSVKGLEKEPEGGLRCAECFRLRLEKTASKAAELSFDYFTTTLTVSPYKNAELLNDIGLEAAGKYNVKFLTADFKKRDGYKRSIELSKMYELYRQDYCGCAFSKVNENKILKFS